MKWIRLKMICARSVKQNDLHTNVWICTQDICMQSVNAVATQDSLSCIIKIFKQYFVCDSYIFIAIIYVSAGVIMQDHAQLDYKNLNKISDLSLSSFNWTCCCKYPCNGDCCCQWTVTVLFDSLCWYYLTARP